MGGIRLDRRGAKRGKRFCPLMKEVCTKGWTPSMGTGPDGFPVEGLCAAWEPVSVFLANENRSIDVFDCTQFGWTVDALGEIAKESYQAGSSADKVANEVAKFHATSIACMPEEERVRLMTTNPRMMPALKENNLSHPRLPDAEKKSLEHNNSEPRIKNGTQP